MSTFDEKLCDQINAYWKDFGVEANARVGKRVDVFPQRWVCDWVMVNGKKRSIWNTVPLEEAAQITVKSFGIISDLGKK